MESIEIHSTSLNSAECKDIILRKTKTTRLVFRAILVKNPHNQDASVKGSFIFMRKGTKDEWVDCDSLPLSKLLKGTQVRWHISSEELLDLYDILTGLYDLYRREGIPVGTHHYIKGSKNLRKLADLDDEELRQVLDTNRAIGADILKRVLKWATTANTIETFLDQLESLDSDDIAKLRNSMGLSSLKAAMQIWEEHQDEADEGFWQEMLIKHFFLLAQLFSYPVVLVKSKACVGGVTFEDTGRKLVDFLIKNQVTHNATLIEIKPPTTLLMGGEYREGVYRISTDLNGAVVQALTYKHSLTEHFASLTAGQDPRIAAFDPHCVVLIGNAKSQLADNPSKKRSFELFRRRISGVEIVTYDELFEKTARLISLLKGEVPSVGTGS